MSKREKGRKTAVSQPITARALELAAALKTRTVRPLRKKTAAERGPWDLDSLTAALHWDRLANMGDVWTE